MLVLRSAGSLNDSEASVPARWEASSRFSTADRGGSNQGTTSRMNIMSQALRRYLMTRIREDAIYIAVYYLLYCYNLVIVHPLPSFHFPQQTQKHARDNIRYSTEYLRV